MNLPFRNGGAPFSLGSRSMVPPVVGRRIGSLACALASLVLLLTPDSALARRSAGCGGLGALDVADLLTGQRIALGLESFSACPALDLSGDRHVTADELVSASGVVCACAPPSAVPKGARSGSISIDSVSGNPGDQVSFSVRFNAPGESVAGMQNDIAFDSTNIPIAVLSGGPDCTVNPAINKNGTSFAFQPPACTGAACTGMRAVVFALDNVDPITDGSVLYTCKVNIAPTAPAGDYPLAISNFLLATPTGDQVSSVTGTDGTVTVGSSTCVSDSECSDGNPCTADTCNPSDPGATSTGCVFAMVTDGTRCDDGNVCNGNETCQAGACVHGNPDSCQAPGAIAFTFDPPTSGSVSYNGSGGVLAGSNIQVDAVIGLDTLANAGVSGNCLGCVLSFTSNALKSTGPNSWTFNGGTGSSVKLNGAVDFDKNGTIDSGDIANTLLVDGIFTGDVTVTTSGSTLKLVLGNIRDEKRLPLRTFYGYPLGVFVGQLSLTFNSAAVSPAGFTSSNLLSGSISNVQLGCEDYLPGAKNTACNADGNLCTLDQCDGVGHCLLVATTSCPDDGQVCNGAEACDPGTGRCVSGPAAPINTPCEADGNLCTTDRCNGSGSCNLFSVVTCPDDGNVCNGPEVCNAATGTCGSGPPATNGTPCESDGNVCTREQCNGAGACIFGSFASSAVACDDDLFCNGADHCNGAGACGIHTGSPCPETACNTCQEDFDTCFDLAGTTCNTDSNLCTVEQCNGTGGCVLLTTTTCPDDGQPCNGFELCIPATGLCGHGPPAGVGTPCEADGNACTIDRCNGAGTCVLSSNNAPGTMCNDGLYCNGSDTCDSMGQCGVHSGDPCPGTQCNMCQEATDTCFDPAATLCDDGDPFTAGDACDGLGMCIGEKYIRDYAILRWPPNAPPEVKTFLRGKVQVGGIVCTDFIGLRKLGVIDGDAVVPRPGPDDAMKFSTDSQVTGGLFTTGGPIVGIGKVIVGGVVDTMATATTPQIARCLAASGQAQLRWADFQALPLTSGMSLGPLIIDAHSSRTVNLPVGMPVVVVDIGDVRMKPYSTLNLVGDSATEQVIVRIKGTKGMRISGRSKIVLQGGLQAEDVIYLVDQRVRLGAFVEVDGTIFGGDRVFVAGHGLVNGQILGTKRITLNPSAILNRRPFFGW